MVIFREVLRVVAHRSVFAAEWKIKTRRSRKRYQFERRGNPKRKIDMLGSGQFRPELNRNCRDERQRKYAGHRADHLHFRHRLTRMKHR
jgi:hypothetical protein